MTADDILRSLRLAAAQTDALDRSRLIAAARRDAASLSDDDFARVERALRNAR